MEDRQHITELLNGLREGDEEARSRLITLVYPELRRIASQYMNRERVNHTLEPTALVHEAYLRIAGTQDQLWQNRNHFFAVASQVMRQVLVDHARRHRAGKRGGGAAAVAFNESLVFDPRDAHLALEIDDALDQLAKLDPRQAHVVVCRIFGGMECEQIAEVTGVSTRTVKRDWKMAKAWLHGVLSGRKHQE
jgi:RNA polymerase sigma-70 factor (ECF subfamily)